MRVLTLNAGSTSLKAHLVAGGRVAAQHAADWQADDRERVLDAALDALRVDGASVDAVAHRIVHGGDRLTNHTLIDDDVEAAIEAGGSLAPLHNAIGLEIVRIARGRLPDVPQIACFDTAFHATLPEIARREPVPESWRALGVRRYGFHGLSVEWSVGRAATLLDRRIDALSLVVAHLGGGASVTAVEGGRSAWCSMGWTPNDGIMMATRSGALDPAIVTSMLGRAGQTAGEVADALERRSGLLGVSGTSGDVRTLHGEARDGDVAARLALDLFVARAAAGIAGAATWLRRVDGLVFTGGIGEHDPTVRSAIVERLAVIGMPRLPSGGHDDADADAAASADLVLASGPPAVLRVTAREELVMAAIAERVTGGHPEASANAGG
jgi:acetate kinase